MSTFVSIDGSESILLKYVSFNGITYILTDGNKEYELKVGEGNWNEVINT